MKKIKLGLGNLSIPDKLARAREINRALTNNPDFPTTIPPLTELTTLTDALETKYDAAQAIRQQSMRSTSEQHDAEIAFEKGYSQLTGFLESATGGDETKILSAGVQVKGSGPSIPKVPTQTQRLSLSRGDNDGEVDAIWDPLPGARNYVLERTTDPPGTPATKWEQAGFSSKSSTTITGLTSGVRIWLRVAGIGTDGRGPWSDPATIIVP